MCGRRFFRMVEHGAVLNHVCFVQIWQVSVRSDPSLHHHFCKIDRLAFHMHVLFNEAMGEHNGGILGTDNTVDDKATLSGVFILLV